MQVILAVEFSEEGARQTKTVYLANLRRMSATDGFPSDPLPRIVVWCNRFEAQPLPAAAALGFRGTGAGLLMRSFFIL